MRPGNAEVRRAFVAVQGYQHTGVECRERNPQLCVPAHRSEFKSVDLPILGIPTTRTFNVGVVSAFSLAMAATGLSILQKSFMVMARQTNIRGPNART